MLKVPCTWFASCRSSQKIDYATWLKYLNILAASKNVDVQSLKSKLSKCGPPATNKTTVSNVGLKLFPNIFMFRSSLSPAQLRG